MSDALEARRQDPRYQRLMAATREAAARGYDAVSMRELAETTHMSLTTVYQFCSSKDHLIAEAHVEGMEAFRADLARRPARGKTAEERVLRVMRGVVNALEQDEALSRTLMRAIYSIDAGVSDAARSVGETYSTIIENAIGDESIEDRAAVISTLGRVIDSAIYGWVRRGEDVAEVRRALEQAVHLLFRPAPPTA